MTIADIFDGIHIRQRPLRRVSIARTTPLAQVSVTVIDTETTGLDPRRDRIVSIAAIRLQGLDSLSILALDLLIDPGIPIPARSSSVHGIHDVDVAASQDFPGAYPAICAAIDHTIVIGHHVAFDLAILAAEARRHGLPWREPLHFDTARLAASLAPHHRGLDLADLLRRFGAEPVGQRHRAADDAAMAASLYIILARQLAAQGRGTVGGALAFG